MDVASVLSNVAKKQNILKLLTVLQLTAYLWPPDATLKDGESADFIIIGGGTAGSIIASYLVKHKNISVIVIEAGGMGEFETQQPGLYPFLAKTEYDWKFTTEPDVTMKPPNKRIIQQGKVLGGCSQIGFAGYGIGHPKDYAKWAAITNDSSWTLENLYPLIKRTEKVTDKTILNSPDVVFHGTEGKLRLKKYHSGINDGFFEAYKEMGIDVLNDINSNHTFGYTNSFNTIGDGNRQSTAYSFLSPERENPNLKVAYHSLATKIIFDVNKRAVAVRVLTKDKKYITIYVKKEVIVTAGAFKSPQLLMLSGIGPRYHLESKRIKVISDLPVGQNLQDQPSTVMVYKMGPKRPVPPQNPHELPTQLMEGRVAIDKCQNRADYLIRSSLFLTNLSFLQACSFIFNIRNEVCDRLQKALSQRQAHLVTHLLLYPGSRGEVLLRSTNPEENPIIKPRYYSNPRDLERHAEYLEHYNRIVNTSYFRRLDAELVDPGLERCKGLKKGSNAYWKCYVLGMASTLHNYVGTCAMGSVVDSELRLIGVKRVRVADASVMPEIVGATVQGTVYIIAQKLVDILFKEYNLSTH
uniref:Glucose-methanol-choline oxidoreductase N-terminal domain-containing protein n=1 Tax=Heliothis virescens TaxID=7102 RepID=A0A2A4JQV7_HELVI